MIHHFAMPTGDFVEARRFHVPVLGAVGYHEASDEAGRLLVLDGAEPELLFYQAPARQTCRLHFTYDTGIRHIALLAASPACVDEAHRQVLRHGGTVLHAPRFYLHQGCDYYALDYLDPDGVKYEMVCVGDTCADASTRE
jgi:catechol 2,3-dioxygenase-like lactoylglutathione lyase family enzyme